MNQPLSFHMRIGLKNHVVSCRMVITIGEIHSYLYLYLDNRMKSFDSEHESMMTINNYNDMDELQSALMKTHQGMLAFVVSEQSLLLRVANGWQYISVN